MCVTLWRLPPVYVGSLRARTRRNSIVESCKGHSTLPTKPFSHLKTQWDLHYMNTHNLCGSAFGNGEALFENLQLITGLLLSTGDLVQTYQEPIGYSVMFFVDAICQQYFIPILQKIQHFLSHKQSFMFSFMQSNQNFIVGKHSTMVENHIEKPWCCLLEKIFDFSSYEDNIEISK